MWKERRKEKQRKGKGKKIEGVFPNHAPSICGDILFKKNNRPRNNKRLFYFLAWKPLPTSIRRFFLMLIRSTKSIVFPSANESIKFEKIPVKLSDVQSSRVTPPPILFAPEKKIRQNTLENTLEPRKSRFKKPSKYSPDPPWIRAYPNHKVFFFLFFLFYDFFLFLEVPSSVFFSWKNKGTRRVGEISPI